MRRALFAPSKPVAALNWAMFVTSSVPAGPPQPPRKLTRMSLAPAEKPGKARKTRYFAGLMGATSVMTSVPRSPNCVVTFGVVTELPVSAPVRLSYDAWSTLPFRL